MASNIAYKASNIASNIVTNASNIASNASHVMSNASTMASNIVSNIKHNVVNIASNSNSNTSSSFLNIMFFYGLIIGLLLLIIYHFQTIKEYGLYIQDYVKKYLGNQSTPEEMIKDMKPSERPSGLPGASDPSLMEKIGENLPQRKEVFNVSRNIYTFNDASAVCRAFGADLATYDQVKDAYDHGADWCNYGWIKGQMAVYPTQKQTWEKLQKGPASSKNACGTVGINGGYFDNPELRFGVNCYGIKPSKNQTDAITNDVQLPKSAEEVEFDKKVQRFRDQLDEINVLPFNRNGITDSSWASS